MTLRYAIFSISDTPLSFQSLITMQDSELGGYIFWGLIFAGGLLGILVGAAVLIGCSLIAKALKNKEG